MTSRALVLGGGGALGIAWETGVLAGLAAHGVDLRDADLVVGTSAGAVVAAQLTAGLDLEELYAAQLSPADGEVAPKTSPFALFSLVWRLTRAKDIKDFGLRMGRYALAADTPPESERQEWSAGILAGVSGWPETRLVITAVDAETGEPADFDATGGVELADAVLASTAGPGVRPPATIGGRRYIDGGMRSAANVDLAAGHDRVVVIAPLAGGGGPMPSARRQIADLGPDTRVALVVPEPKSWRAVTGRRMGGMLDPARRAPAAADGRARAAEVAAAVAEVWRG
jgi:NTE family protein